MTKNLYFLTLAILIGGCQSRTTYAEGCGSLPANWKTPRQGRSVTSTLDVITVSSNGTIFLNGVNVSMAKVASYLKLTAKQSPAPITQIRFDHDVDCEAVVRWRNLMLNTLDCSLGYTCAEGHGRWWKVGDVGPPFVTYDPRPDLPQDQEVDSR